MLLEGESRLNRRQLFDTGFRIAGATASGLFLASCEQTSNPSDIALHITYPPGSGEVISKVKSQDTVSGTINGTLPRGYGIIVFNRGVSSANEPYHPQAPLDKNGHPIRYYVFTDASKQHWAADSRFGYKDNESQDVYFEVIATLADPDGITNVNRYFQDHPNFPGLLPLPKGISIKSTVPRVLRPAGW